MNTSETMKRNGSSMWPYVIVGSAIGGAVGYLFMTESGRKIRRAVAHPDELANNLEDARSFIEKKARTVTERVHGILNKAKLGIEEGERAYRQAEQDYQSRLFGRIEGKSNEITSGVHKTVDNMSRTAVTIEQSVVDPICEIGALYKGVERGIRFLLGKTGDRTAPLNEGPIPIRDQRAMGDY